MRTHSVVAVLVGVLLIASVPVTAQQLLPQPDSPQAQLRTTLRAFYFSLAHQDWEALSAHILPAKMVAHRPAPEALVAASKIFTRPPRALGSAPVAGDSSSCSASAAPLVDQASITFDGDWAEVSVPRCTLGSAGIDEFRFIHFEGRWWIVYIELASDSGAGRPGQ